MKNVFLGKSKNNKTLGIVLCQDSREALRHFPETFDLIVTSPPYADARKNHYDSIHPDKFADWFCSFHEPFWNALKPTGSLVINIKDKVVNGVRHRYVWRTIEMLADLGWLCIEDYIWYKTNPMPGYWPSRLRDGWEYCFHLSKSKNFYMNQDAVRIPIGDWVNTRFRKMGDNDHSRQNSINRSGFGRNISRWMNQKTALPTNVLAIPLIGKNMGHPAVFPPALPSFFIKLLCPPDGAVLDPFGGSGMTGQAAMDSGKDFLLVDNNLDYCRIAYQNLKEKNAKKESQILLFEALDEEKLREIKRGNLAQPRLYDQEIEGQILMT
jgi:DNA modification methylase